MTSSTGSTTTTVASPINHSAPPTLQCAEKVNRYDSFILGRTIFLMILLQAATTSISTIMTATFPTSVSTGMSTNSATATNVPLGSTAGKPTRRGRDRSSTATTAFVPISLQLIPSQIVSSATTNARNGGKTHPRIIQQGQHDHGTTMVVSANNNRPIVEISEKTSSLSYHPNATVRAKKKGKTKRKVGTGIASTKTTLERQGNIPDLEWRAIPMEHLRRHPYFVPLPLPDQITHLNHLEDVRYFRQQSWQWDVLHRGRCTTSQVAPALGLLEPKASRVLGIPKSLQYGGVGAFHRLSQTPLRTLQDMNQVLCHSYIEQPNQNRIPDEQQHIMSKVNYTKKPFHDTMNENKAQNNIWSKQRFDRYPFAAKYHPKMSGDSWREKRRLKKDKFDSSVAPLHGARMIWGDSQEATAILTAINYFAKIDPGVTVKEVGMCGAGLDINSTNLSPQSLLIGASPDAVIQYSNGTLEALEVKNHCPFVLQKSNVAQGTSNSEYNYAIRELPLRPTVPPAYLPQLMMEMVCLGPACKSAVMVRQTAISGAIILRLRRDEGWIHEMLYWLNKFIEKYVSKDVPPPQDFFWDDDEESERYRTFVKQTKEKAENVELVAYIRSNSIQRIVSDNGTILPLFLD